ncbi:MAG: S41 family peptidase [Cyclobacteriaceae bacterium]|nr:S41 family peptidase [Cyclobacteriaceae bacterium]
MRRIRKIHFVLVALVLLCVLAFSPAERYFEIAKSIDIFASLFKEVNKLYVDDISPTKIAHNGIDQMLNSLDPYTNYISEDQVEDYRTQNTGQYGGIGALTRVFNKKTIITMVYADYPAYKNGLRIGDEVIKMDGIELSKLSQEEANHLMRGQVGTPVKLSIKRYGQDQPFDLEFKREKIKINNVPYSGMLADDVGYIQLTEFTPDAGKEVKAALVNLKEKGAKNIIIDLRGNPGGLLFEAVNICNLFVPKGKKIVDTKGKLAEHNVTYETLNNPVDTEIPVVVLINRGSASASEIVAGTLQDYDRAVVVGERSFGKGLVQLSRPLPYHAQVKITTAKYYTPTGRCIQVLDYTHRREDGSAGSVPDSLKKEFKTSKGRKVYDGGGIDPDIKLPAQEASSITQALHVNGFIFEYATQYAFNHSTIQDPKTFALTDKEYDVFVQWMKDKNYTYHTALQSELAAVEEEAKREKYYDQLKPSIEALSTKLKESRKHDLMNFKDQIKILLEEEIAARYYLEKGAVEARFKYDLEVKKAIDIFHDPAFYKKILGSN